MATIDIASQNRIDQARKFFDSKDWGGLWKFKHTCKKTFKQLGLTSREEDTAKFYKPDWI